MTDWTLTGGRRQATTTEPITEKQLRKQVAAQVEPHGFTVDSFLAADLAERCV